MDYYASYKNSKDPSLLRNIPQTYTLPPVILNSLISELQSLFTSFTAHLSLIKFCLIIFFLLYHFAPFPSPFLSASFRY